MLEYVRSLGDAVKNARIELGLTQNEVADKIDVDVRTILNIENYNDIKVGDIVEGYEEFEVKRKL